VKLKQHPDKYKGKDDYEYATQQLLLEKIPEKLSNFAEVYSVEITKGLVDKNGVEKN
jgi:hypothetical protein